MPRPEGLTDEEWDALIKEKALEKGREQRRQRIQEEGFETNASDSEPGETCEFRLWMKSKGRWMYRPCGDQALIEFEFAGPQNPHGIKVKLCRRCIGRHIRDLVGYLEV